jgi:hypothetical protein
MISYSSFSSLDCYSSSSSFSSYALSVYPPPPPLFSPHFLPVVLPPDSNRSFQVPRDIVGGGGAVKIFPSICTHPSCRPCLHTTSGPALVVRAAAAACIIFLSDLISAALLMIIRPSLPQRSFLPII